MERRDRVQGVLRHMGTAAAVACGVAVIAFAAALDGYSHLVHPVGLLGAAGMPGAPAFNVLAFGLPGVAAAAVGVRLRGRLPAGAGVAAGMGCWMLAVSGIAFAAQGLLPLDVNALDGPVSQRHAAAWLLWWVAFVPGALALAAGLVRPAGWHRFALAQALLAGVVLVMVAVPFPWWPAPVSQRIALCAWLLAVTLAGRR